MRLRCGEIFNNCFVTQSLLSLTVKRFENLLVFAEVLG